MCVSLKQYEPNSTVLCICKSSVSAVSDQEVSFGLWFFKPLLYFQSISFIFINSIDKALDWTLMLLFFLIWLKIRNRWETVTEREKENSLSNLQIYLLKIQKILNGWEKQHINFLKPQNVTNPVFRGSCLTIKLPWLLCFPQPTSCLLTVRVLFYGWKCR